MTLRVEMYQGTWKMKFILKIRCFHISKTNDARRKRVSSLKTCKLRNQFVMASLGWVVRLSF